MRKKIILLADNHYDFLNTRAEYLENAGYIVYKGDSLNTARQIFQDQNIDLAIIDKRLVDDTDDNDWSGIYLAREIHKTKPVIILTDFPTHETVRESLRRDSQGESAADDYIYKDDGPKAMIESIQNLFANVQIKTQRLLLILATTSLVAVLSILIYFNLPSIEISKSLTLVLRLVAILSIGFVIFNYFRQKVIWNIEVILAGLQVILAAMTFFTNHPN